MPAVEFWAAAGAQGGPHGYEIATRILSLNADKGLKEGLHFGARTKTLLELCERGFQM